MEIHAPHHPILSLKEAAVHLCIVTLGILIALSFEEVREWWRHRELVQETRQHLRNEIRADQDAIRSVLKSMDKTEALYAHAIDVLGDPAARRRESTAIFGPGREGLLSGPVLAWLNTASYSEAQFTGALALMEYSEANRYSDVYELQAIYVQAQDAAEKDVFVARALAQSALSQPSATEIQDSRRQLRLAIAGMRRMQNVAGRLDQVYSEALQAAP